MSAAEDSDPKTSHSVLEELVDSENEELPDLVESSDTSDEDEEAEDEGISSLMASVVIAPAEEKKEGKVPLPQKVIDEMERSPGGVVVYPIEPNDHRPYYKSLKYLSEEGKYGRNANSDVTYENRIMCRYFCTSRGCKQGDSCRFLHAPKLGCVFHQMAHQGCVYGESGDCPFSHDPDAVVVAPSLSSCKNFAECGHSCMFKGSTCLTCFNKTSRERRGRVRAQQNERRSEFAPCALLQPPPAEAFQNLYQPVPTTRNFFGQTGAMATHNPYTQQPIWTGGMPPPRPRVWQPPQQQQQQQQQQQHGMPPMLMRPYM